MSAEVKLIAVATCSRCNGSRREPGYEQRENCLVISCTQCGGTGVEQTLVTLQQLKDWLKD